MFEYFMVQIPPNISVKFGATQGAAAEYLWNVVGQHAVQGWEFYSIETIGITENPGCGCFGALIGIRPTQSVVYVIVFRKPIVMRPTVPTPPPVQNKP
jgi:hypothetical protein